MTERGTGRELSRPFRSSKAVETLFPLVVRGLSALFGIDLFNVGLLSMTYMATSGLSRGSIESEHVGLVLADRECFGDRIAVKGCITVQW